MSEFQFVLGRMRTAETVRIVVFPHLPATANIPHVILRLLVESEALNDCCVTLGNTLAMIAGEKAGIFKVRATICHGCFLQKLMHLDIVQTHYAWMLE